MDKNTAIQILTDLSNGVKIKLKGAGICYNFEQHPYNDRYLSVYDTLPDSAISVAVKLWDKYSGNPRYPVSCKGIDPDTAYCTTEHLWDFSTEYGQNRKELCQYLIEVLKNES